MSKLPFSKIEDHQFTVDILQTLDRNLFNFNDEEKNTLKTYGIEKYVNLIKRKYSEDNGIQMYIDDIEPFL